MSTVEAADAADQIAEAAEEEERTSDNRFKTRAAISIAILAMLLAIASLGGENAGKEMVNANIKASDTWAFYQAKNIRQTDYRLAADQLEIAAASLSGEAQNQARQRVQSYRATADRYESEPAPDANGDPTKGEGKRELLALATDWEHKRDHAQAQDPNFDYSTALFQIAIVLGSVAIVASRRPVLYASWALGAVALVLMLNGFFLLFDLPIG